MSLTLNFFWGDRIVLEKLFSLHLRPLFFWLFAILIVVTGCRTADRYSYSGIQAEYKGSQLAVHTDTSGFKPETNQKVSGVVSALSIEEPLTIEEVLSIALNNNTDLNQARFRVHQAKAMTDISYAAFWPSLGFYSEYMQGDAPSSYLFKTIDQRKLPDDVNFNDPGWFENYETGLTARMNLFNSGKDYLAVRMAQKGETIADLDQKAIENSLVAQVIITFYDTLAAMEFIDIARRSVNTVSEQLRIMQVRFEGGGALKSDLLSLEVRLAQAKEQLLTSENHYKIALMTLSNLMGVDTAHVDNGQVLLKKSFPDTSSVPETYHDGITYALEHRPELAGVRQKLIQSRMGLDSAKAGYLPRLDIMARYYMADPNMKYNIDRENWVAAITLNWDIFTGFSTSANVRKAEAMFKEMLEADRHTILGIGLDVKTAYLKLEEAQSRYQVAISALDSAEESFRLVKNHYLGGSVPVTRYLETELDLTRTRIRATAAFYDRIKATSDVARAIGLWSSQTIFPEKIKP